MTKEIRMITEPVEIRANDTGEEFIEGYALKFNRWSEKLGWFKEMIDQRALDETDMSDVVALFNHSENMPLARNVNEGNPGKLDLHVDNIGLKYRFQPSDTSYARDLKANLKAGIVRKSSFAFSLDYNDDTSEEWRYNDGDKVYERTIRKISKIYDVSPVVSPAYSDTEAVIGARSKEKVEQIKREIEKPQQTENNGLFLLREKCYLAEKL